VPAGSFTVITSVPARRRVRTWHRLSILFVALAWPLAASALPPAVVAAAFAATGIVAVALLRPRLGGPLDTTLLLLLATLGLLLIPLPAPLVAGLKPWLAIPGEQWPMLAENAAVGEQALLTAAGGLGLFWSARDTFTSGGLRRTAAGIAVLGALASTVVLSHVALGIEPALVPDSVHLSAWPMLAIPVALGLAGARRRSAGYGTGRPPIDARRAAVEARHPAASDRRPGRRAPDAVAGRLAEVAALLTGVGLLVLGGHGAALTLAVTVGGAMLVLVWTRVIPRGSAQFACVLGVAGLIAIGLADLSADGVPAALAVSVGHADRPALVGRDLSHGLYAALPAYGGVPLVAAVAAMLAFLWRDALRAIAREPSRGALLIRAGAAVGLAALALLCVWDEPLVAPANAALTAVLGAIVVHDPPAANRDGLAAPG
jgi:hypothetical protein